MCRQFVGVCARFALQEAVVCECRVHAGNMDRLPHGPSRKGLWTSRRPVEAGYLQQPTHVPPYEALFTFNLKALEAFSPRMPYPRKIAPWYAWALHERGMTYDAMEDFTGVSKSALWKHVRNVRKVLSETETAMPGFQFRPGDLETLKGARESFVKSRSPSVGRKVNE